MSCWRTIKMINKSTFLNNLLYVTYIFRDRDKIHKIHKFECRVISELCNVNGLAHKCFVVLMCFVVITDVLIINITLA